MICERSDDILKIECDMASLHTVITKFPAQVENLEDLEAMIKKTIQLYKKYPVDSLGRLNEQYKIKKYVFSCFLSKA